METIVLKSNKQNLPEVAAAAGALLRNGEVVAIPTETVYGLAAQIFDDDAVHRIFTVKGRPQDNPLIVHISDLKMMDGLVQSVPECAGVLIQHFWPGPLTIIFKKTEKVSDVVTCGLDSVAIRFPEHPVARAIIDAAGIPLAAPSANLSGKPSPTTADHCVHDLDGLIPLIIDGGECRVGVESTVISVTGEVPMILRPGIISLEEIRRWVPEAEISPAVFREVKADEKVESPGLKHRHYSPGCEVILIDSDSRNYIEYLEKNAREGDVAMCFSEESERISIPHVSYGNASSSEEQAHNIFAILRDLDSKEVKRILIHAPGHIGKALAVSNRLIRAAGFQVVEIK